MAIFFSSDQHWHHANVIKYTNRPYQNIVEMDEALIQAWNSVVNPGDTVYHLGDLTLGKSIGDIVFRLNGHIRILSNPWHHDGGWLKKQTTKQLIEFGIVDLLESIVVLESPCFIILCHYAFEIWDRRHYGSLHFHGHSHGMLPKVKNRLDIGVDNAYKLVGKYRPLSLDEAIKFAKEELNDG